MCTTRLDHGKYFFEGGWEKEYLNWGITASIFLKGDGKKNI